MAQIVVSYRLSDSRSHGVGTVMLVSEGEYALEDPEAFEDALESVQADARELEVFHLRMTGDDDSLELEIREPYDTKDVMAARGIAQKILASAEKHLKPWLTGVANDR